MKFTSIPENGLSWHDALLYAFDTEGGARDVTMVIRDAINDCTIGTMRLYGVTQAEVDIAPYLRSYMAQWQLPEQSGLSISSAACRVVAEIDGVTSPARTLFYGRINPIHGAALSGVAETRVVRRSDVVRLTLYSPRKLSVRITDAKLGGVVGQFEVLTSYMPYEFTFNLADVPVGVSSLVVDVRGDGQEVAQLRYSISRFGEAARQVAWRNRVGGVECYTFPVCRATECSAEVVGDAEPRLTSAVIRRRLESGQEASTERARIAQMICATAVYGCEGLEVEPMRLLTRRLIYGEGGAMKSLELDVEEAWKGGRRETAY